MIQVLNANKTDYIIKYFNERRNEIFISNSIEYTLFNKADILRNMIFNEYLIAIALMKEEKIVKLVLFNMEDLDDKSRNIQLLAGDTDENFIKMAIDKIKDFLDEFNLSKVTVRSDFDICKECLENFKNQGYTKEIDIVIGNHRFFQYSLFLNRKGAQFSEECK